MTVGRPLNEQEIEKIRRLRYEERLTAHEVAERCAVSPDTVWTHAPGNVAGMRSAEDRALLDRLAKVYNLELAARAEVDRVMQAAWAAGLSNAEIARTVGLRRDTVRMRRIRLGERERTRRWRLGATRDAA